MADVSRRRDEAEARGQMLLVAAFGVAVMLVALVLILNTAIYTENLATRGSDIAGGKDAARYRSVTEDTLRTTVRTANYEDNTSADTDNDYDPLTNSVRWAAWNFSNVSGQQQALDSIVTNSTVSRISEGTRVYRIETGDFNDSNDNPNWTVASGVAGVRNFSITGKESDITQKDPGDVDAPIDLTEDPEFRVLFDTGDEYRVYIYRPSSDGTKVRVDVKSSAMTDGNCVRSIGADDLAQINITNASVEQQHCPALARLGRELDGETYDIAFKLAHDGQSTHSIKGNYSLVVNESFGNVPASASPGSPSLNEPGGGSSPPFKTRAIYSTTLHLVYESKRLLLETDVRVAPEEFDD